jgi:hypothetical protein
MTIYTKITVIGSEHDDAKSIQVIKSMGDDNSSSSFSALFPNQNGENLQRYGTDSISSTDAHSQTLASVAEWTNTNQVHGKTDTVPGGETGDFGCKIEIGANNIKFISGHTFADCTANKGILYYGAVDAGSLIISGPISSNAWDIGETIGSANATYFITAFSDGPGYAMRRTGSFVSVDSGYLTWKWGWANLIERQDILSFNYSGIDIQYPGTGITSSEKLGLKIGIGGSNIILKTVNKSNESNPTYCYIADSGNTILGSNTFSAHTATFNQNLTAGSYYYIYSDTPAGSYLFAKTGSIALPISSNYIDFEKGYCASSGGDLGSTIYNISSLGLTINTGSSLEDDFNVGEEVIIYVGSELNPTNKLFTGIIEKKNLQGKETQDILKIQGRDYSARLQDSTIEPEVYNDISVGSIILDIVNKYVEDVTTNNVNSGINYDIDHVVFNQINCFDSIKQLADQVRAEFWVDTDKDLHFKLKTAAVDTGVTLNSGNTINIAFKENRDDLYNKIWVYGDKYLVGHQEIRIQSGTGSVFTLLYKPHNTTIVVDGDFKGGAVYDMIAVPQSGMQYLVDYHGRNIIFTSGPECGDNIPTSGAAGSIVIDYFRNRAIVKYKEDDNSIINYGPKSKVIVDTSIQNPNMAYNIATAFLREHKDPILQGTCGIKGLLDLDVGKKVTANFPNEDVNNQEYNILELRYDFKKSTNIPETVITVRLNKKAKSAVDTIKEMMLDIKKLQGQTIQDAPIVKYITATGSFVEGMKNWTARYKGIGSSFILGHEVNGLLGSYITHTLGWWGDADWTIFDSGGTF